MGTTVTEREKRLPFMYDLKSFKLEKVDKCIYINSKFIKEGNMRNIKMCKG